MPLGSFVTGKQITFDAHTDRLYWCDREGMRVMQSLQQTLREGDTYYRLDVHLQEGGQVETGDPMPDAERKSSPPAPSPSR